MGRGGGVTFTLGDEPDVGDLYSFCHEQEGQVPTPPTHLEVDGHRVLAGWDGLSAQIRVVRRRGDTFLRLDCEILNELPDHRLRLHVRLVE